MELCHVRKKPDFCRSKLLTHISIFFECATARPVSQIKMSEREQMGNIVEAEKNEGASAQAGSASASASARTDVRVVKHSAFISILLCSRSRFGLALSCLRSRKLKNPDDNN